jgi:N6-adenosine-specific RNA methylase IME4
VGNLPTLFPKGPSDVVTGNIVGHSEQDVNKIVEMVAIAEQKPELKHLIEEVDDGKKRLNTAYAEMIRAQDRDIPKPAPPEGQFDVIYADPPWSYENDPVRGSPRSHYETMTNEEIMDLSLPAADDSILFLWVPYPKTMEISAILDRWGFRYRSEIVWVKDKFGTGWYVRGQHEKLYICIKGDGLGIPAEQDRPPSVIHAPRTKHSKKPEIFYSIIERMYPNRKRIEMFARGKRREGWETWGLEAGVGVGVEGEGGSQKEYDN